MPSMAPRLGAEASLRSALCSGVEDHAVYPTLALTLFTSMLVMWLDAANLTVGFHRVEYPWNISRSFSVQRLGAAL